MGKIGFVGLGKLGYPVAVAIASRGFDVLGYDVSPTAPVDFRQREDGLGVVSFESLRRAAKRLEIAPDLDSVVRECDVIFVAVQTPHDPEYEGITPMPEKRRDFDYRPLVACMEALQLAAVDANREPVVAIISTVLPGTIRREILPLTGQLRIAYNPSFIAMGTTVKDFLMPEFVLIGGDDEMAKGAMVTLYRELFQADSWRRGSTAPPIVTMGLESAELTKVAYNTFITTKIVFANTLMEVCDHVGANVDDVSWALSKGVRRLLSPSYTRAGMGDGGGCHPRDNIALSWLATQHGLSCDLFGFLVRAREAQTEWLAYKVAHAATEIEERRELEARIVVLGRTFKPGTNLTTGSPSALLVYYLRNMGMDVTEYDPELGDEVTWRDHDPRGLVFVIATAHERFRTEMESLAPAGSIIVDPHGMFHRQSLPDRTVIAVGRH